MCVICAGRGRDAITNVNTTSIGWYNNISVITILPTLKQLGIYLYIYIYIYICVCMSIDHGSRECVCVM